MLEYVIAIIVGLFFGKILHESFKVKPKVESIEKPVTKEEHLDESEDFIYVVSHETDEYVHLWQFEPALDLETQYLGKFPKYDEWEYLDIINSVRKNRGVRMSVNILSEGMVDMLQRLKLEAELNKNKHLDVTD